MPARIFYIFYAHIYASRRCTMFCE